MTTRVRPNSRFRCLHSSSEFCDCQPLTCYAGFLKLLEQLTVVGEISKQHFKGDAPLVAVQWPLKWLKSEQSNRDVADLTSEQES